MNDGEYSSGDITFSRACPRCGHFWTSRNEWHQDTTLTGRENRELDYRHMGKQYHFEIYIELRDHVLCGGGMISEGLVRKEKVSDVERRRNV